MQPGSGMDRLLLLGHRGARAVKSIPENTLASFDRALADGCDGFEFDVRMTADEQAVVCHDSRFKKIEIGRAPAQKLPQLPTLEDVLARYHEKAFLDIELKVPGLERITAASLRKYPAEQGCVVSSFLPEVLRSLHQDNPSIPLGLICERPSQLAHWKDLPLQYVIAYKRLVNAAVMKELRRAGKKLFVWTVNLKSEMEDFARLGVDGIISDRASLLCRTLKH
jgi:glycerophosphoryl diester phosphodiesterase